MTSTRSSWRTSSAYWTIAGGAIIAIALISFTIVAMSSGCDPSSSVGRLADAPAAPSGDAFTIDAPTNALTVDALAADALPIDALLIDATPDVPVDATDISDAPINGGLVLSLKAVPQLATNCSQPPTGAGITSTTISLQHDVSGPCEPLTFTHTRGAAVLPPYTVDCGSPVVVGCMETDETLAASMPSGAYTIHVIGKINGADCWQNNDALQVLPRDNVAQVLNLSFHAEICPR
jgi:hypothetical protein